MDRIDRISSSRAAFFSYVEKCNKDYRSSHELALYRELILMHRKFGNLELLLEEEIFLKKMHETLGKWNMDQRGARLAPLCDIVKSVRSLEIYLFKLYEFKVYGDKNNDILNIKQLLEKVFCNLKIMESSRRIVGVSKALHFLLPDLIMPIDGKFTLPAFFGYNKISNTPRKEFSDFWEIIGTTFEITESLELNQSDVDGIKWNTSVPKLIDNAIIGLMKSENE